MLDNDNVILLALQVKLWEANPGMLSHKLKEALGMPVGAPPPWLVNMQVKSVFWVGLYLFT